VEVEVKSYVFGSQAPGLNDTAIAKAVDERHRRWSEQLPREPGDLWDALVAFDADSCDALFAHCVGMSLNAVHEPWNRRPRALAHADRIAEAIVLDVAAAAEQPKQHDLLQARRQRRALLRLGAPMSTQVSDLARRLAERAEMVCRYYLSNGRRSGNYWLVGDVNNTPGRSMFVRLRESSKGAAGKWTDAATGGHGAGEGIETMLSLHCILPTLPMAAALSAAHLIAIMFPATLRRLYVARDDDPAGNFARDRLFDRARHAGIDVLALSPELGDFNDDLRLLGKQALRASVRIQLLPEDVTSFMPKVHA
jgi:hypothetical protein